MGKGCGCDLTLEELHIPDRGGVKTEVKDRVTIQTKSAPSTTNPAEVTEDYYLRPVFLTDNQSR